MFGRSPLSHAPHIKFVNAVWSTNNTGVAGVVLLYDTLEKEYKIYWGAVEGNSEREDIVYLSNYGSKAPVSRANMWFGELQDNPFSNEE